MSRNMALLRDEYKSWGEALCFPPTLKTFRWGEREERSRIQPHPTTLVP